MKALTIHQPYAWAIANGFKTIENRTWAPDLDSFTYLAIHASSRKPTKKDIAKVCALVPPEAELPKHYTTGAVLAVCCVVDVVKNHFHDPWFKGPYGWVLEGHKLKHAIVCKGRQGLWDVPEPQRKFVLEGLRRAMLADFSDDIREARELRDMTQVQVANLIGLSTRRFISIEQGDCAPWGRLLHLLDLLGGRIEW